MSDHQARVDALGHGDRAEYDRLQGEWQSLAGQGKHEAGFEARARSLEIVYPERRAEREAHEARTREHLLQPRQFFHGTDASLRKGDTVRPASSLGRRANWPTYGNEGHAYAADSLPSAHIYAQNVADMRQSNPRIYQVEPAGHYEPDPDEKGGGFRSAEGWKVVRRVPRGEWGH